jgi:hypothetical protein
MRRFQYGSHHRKALADEELWGLVFPSSRPVPALLTHLGHHSEADTKRVIERIIVAALVVTILLGHRQAINLVVLSGVANNTQGGLCELDVVALSQRSADHGAD